MAQPSATSVRAHEPRTDPKPPAPRRATGAGNPLSEDEKSGLTVAVQSVFRKLDKLYEEIVPLFRQYGFKPPSAGVVARDPGLRPGKGQACTSRRILVRCPP
jgi:hypothetical protein